jgi:hypothetical protein
MITLGSMVVKYAWNEEFRAFDGFKFKVNA